VHFSQTPPPEGQQAETVELPPAPARGASEDAAGANPPPGDKPAAAPDTEAADPVEAWREQRQENCQRARANLRVLQGPGRVAMPQEGGQKVLSKEERSEQIDEARRQIQVFCE